MAEQWIPALVFLVLCFVMPGSMLVAAKVFEVRPKHPSPVAGENYECGEEPDGMAWVQFHPRYYVVALVFVLFDVEAAFLFPWAIGLRELGSTALAEMFAFLGILLLGWAYAVRKGAIRWQ